MTMQDLEPEQALDSLLEEAKAGVSDQWLASTADVSLRQVAIWKRKRGLESSDKSSVAGVVSALQGLASGYDPTLHRSEHDLDWEAPVYVLRRPLHYTHFARACHALNQLAEMTPEMIARSLGTRETDVETALKLWRRHLANRGTSCLCCQTLVDPRYSEFCSRRCHDKAR